MRDNEIVIRGLVREWLIVEQASDEGKKAGETAAAALGGLSGLEGQIDSALEKIDKKIESTNESLTALALGFGLSLPTLVKWGAAAISYIVKGYVALANKFSSSDQSKKLAWAEKVKSAGVSFYEAGHHMIEGLFAKIVKALYLLLCATSDPDNIGIYKEYADSSEGEAEFLKIAKIIDLAVTTILAVYSVTGAVDAITAGYRGLAATEGVLSLVKGAHIGTAVGEALAEAARAFGRALANAGMAAALISDVMKKASEFFGMIKESIVAGVETAKSAAAAAGLAVALAAGSGERTDVPPTDDVSAQVYR